MFTTAGSQKCFSGSFCKSLLKAPSGTGKYDNSNKFVIETISTNVPFLRLPSGQSGPFVKEKVVRASEAKLCRWESPSFDRSPEDF